MAGFADGGFASRAVGNALYSSGEYSRAQAEYTRGIAKTREIDAKGIMLSNRAACWLALDEDARAASDAWAATKCIPENAKAWYRAGIAEVRLGRSVSAVRAARRAIRLAPKSHKVRQLRKDAEALLVQSADLYQEASSPAGAAIQRLRDELRDKNFFVKYEEDFSAGLRKLATSNQAFRSTVFPGAPASSFEKKLLPNTFLDMLSDQRYADALEDAWIRAVEKAKSILQNTKERGKQENDIMDAETEAKLWPAIVREAFCRELPTVAHRVARAAFDQNMSRPRILAQVSPTKNTATPLPCGVAAALSLADTSMPKSVACSIPNFLGSAWAFAVFDDVKRFRLEQRLSPARPVFDDMRPNTSGLLAWLEDTDLDDDFPALAELARRLAGLAAGIISNQYSSAQLVLPLPQAQAQVPPRLCGLLPPTQGSLLLELGIHDIPQPPSTESDALISCLYFLKDPNTSTTGGGHLLLEYNGKPHTLTPEPDTLILWRSDLVASTRQPITEGIQLSVRHWIFGHFADAPNRLDQQNEPPALAQVSMNSGVSGDGLYFFDDD